MATAVDEFIRWASPVAYFARRAAYDTEVRGVPIAEGDRITMWFGSANRDHDAIADPFTFEKPRSPNPHVSFGGGGPHYCLGAHLAKREITILFEELLARTREIEVLAPPSYTVLGVENPVMLAVNSMPVRLA
jgi:cytochrome P450